MVEPLFKGFTQGLRPSCACDDSLSRFFLLVCGCRRWDFKDALKCDCPGDEVPISDTQSFLLRGSHEECDCAGSGLWSVFYYFRVIMIVLGVLGFFFCVLVSALGLLAFRARDVSFPVKLYRCT